MSETNGIQRPQQYRGRVRTGCLTCRSRKVRCDEAKPTCRNCTKSQRFCQYKPKQAQQRVSKDSNQLSPAQETIEVAPVPQPTPPSSGYCESSTSSTVSPLETSLQNAFHHQEDWSLDSDLVIDTGLERFSGGPLSTQENQAETDSTSSLISRDIQLCTTMDLLRAHDEHLQSSTVFLELVECPGITPFDRVNWNHAKYQIVERYKSCRAVSQAITAISTLHHTLMYNLSPARAIDYATHARVSLDELLGEHSLDFSTALATIFILCVFEVIISDEETIAFKEPSQILLQRVKAWAKSPLTHTPLCKRLITWLKIIQTITNRGGGRGLLSEELYEILPNYEGPLPLLQTLPDHQRDVSTDLHQVLSAPLFDFYFQLQIISGRIAKETHYRRTRKSGSDQDEVVRSMTVIKSQLQALWESRSTIQRQTAKDIRSQLAPSIANIVIELIRICNTAYYAEYVEIDRVLGDPLTKWTGSREAIRSIQQIVDDDWEESYMTDGKGLNPGYLRALFLCAIECMDRDQNQWAVERISDIRGASYRSKFFADFGRALSEAQIERKRRVTSKYFCIWYFGGPPPFL